MSAAGWSFLIISWSTVAGFVAYCFYRIFKND